MGGTLSANPSRIVLPSTGKLITPDEWHALKASQIGCFPGLSGDQAFKLRPISEFKPSPAMVPWLWSRARFILVRAGNRVGKSRHAAAKLVALALRRPGGRYRAVGVTFRQVARVIGKLLYELIPAQSLTSDSKYSPTRGWLNQLIRFKNGSEIELRSYDQEQAAHAGNALDGVWLDEPPPFDLFIENMTRLLDLRGWMIVTCTPAGYPLQWFKDLVEAVDSEWEQYVIPFSRLSCPWYDEAQIKDWIDRWRKIPALYGQRINGDWEGVTENRKFTGFDPVKHRRARDKSAKNVDVFRLGLDHGNGENRQIALLSGVVFLPGTHCARAAHVYREFKSGRGVMGPPEIARGIVDMIEDLAAEAGISPKVILGKLKAYGDSNAEGLGRTGLYNTRIEEALSALGYPIRINCPVKVAGARQDGEALLNALAQADCFTVDPSCSLTIDALNHYTGTEQLKDPIDGLRYGLFDVLAAPTTLQPQFKRG